MKKSLLLGICFYLLSGHGFGAEKLTLEQFLTLVKEHNKDIKLAAKNLETAKAMKKEAWATALPKLNAQATYRRNILTNYIYIDFPDFETGITTTQKFKISFNNEYALNAVLSQPVFSFKIGNALRAAKRFEKTTDYAYKAQYQAILAGSKIAFYQTLLLKKNVEVAIAAEANAKENYDNVKNKYDNGLASQLQLLQAEARWKNLIPETSLTKRNYDLALNNLKTLSGLDLEHDIDLLGDLESYPVLPDSIAFADILKKRPDYNALYWEKKLRENGVRNEQAGYLPSLDASVIYAFSSISDYFQFDRKNENIIVGLTLNIPIYTGGFTGAQVQKAKVELDKTNIKIKQTEELIYNQIHNIYLRLHEAYQRILSAKMNLATVEKAYTIAQKSADNGLATQLELKDARVLFDQTQLGYYAAIFDYLSAYYDWEQATGNVK
jgi:outer membrane protein TolC